MSSGSAALTKLPLALRQALEKGDCVLFLGAGIGCHYKRPDGRPAPDGKELVDELIRQFKLNIDATDLRATDLPRVAQLAEIRSSRALSLTVSSRKHSRIWSQTSTSGG